MNDYEIRERLQQMASYREVCQAVRSGAGHTLVNAVIWLGITYMMFELVGLDVVVLVYLALGLAELFVGCWKWWFPSVEAVLGDGLVLLGFGGFVLGRQFLAWQGVINWPVNPVSIFLGVWWLFDAHKAFGAYFALRRAFPNRPTREQIAWFNGLIREIRASHPDADPDSLDLPTTPHLKAKLLGTTAFFVATKGESIWVLGRDEFAINRSTEDHGTGRRPAEVMLYAARLPQFEIDDASWKNYQSWRAATPSTLENA